MSESPSPGIGGILHALLATPPEDGAPFVHDLTPRRCESCTTAEDPECREGVLYQDGGETNDYEAIYAGRCGCGCHRLKPSYTLTAVGEDGLGGLTYLPDQMQQPREEAMFGTWLPPLTFIPLDLDDPVPTRQPTRRELNRTARMIGRCFDVPPWVIGISPPPLAIDGHAYRRRQRNRIKRRRR